MKTAKKAAIISFAVGGAMTVAGFIKIYGVQAFLIGGGILIVLLSFVAWVSLMTDDG